MEITYNGMSNPANTVSFTGLPNILKIRESNSGTYASLKITITDLSKVDLSKEYYLTIGGQSSQKLISTFNISNATGNKFYLTNANDATSKATVAWKLVESLRSLSTLPINYNISVQTSPDGSISPVILIQAKTPGSLFNLSVSSNLLQGGIISIQLTNGTSSSSLMQGKSNKIIVEVYSPEIASDPINNSSYVMGNYVTTLTKEFFGEDIYFDLSPLITSMAEYGKLNEINLYVYLLSDSTLSLLQVVKDLYFTTGYSVNQGVDYIPQFSNAFLAQNVSRGNTQGTKNNTILYTYNPEIIFSLYLTGITEGTLTPLWSINVKYLDSAKQTFQSTSMILAAKSCLTDVKINLNKTWLNEAFYVDVTVQGVGTLRYNVIKPLKATDEMQRVYWTNSYGGTSFFDFTGSRSETRKTKVDYYQKNLFDYYEKDTVELNKVYNKNVTVSVSLSTHNIEKDGTWQFFDLQNSKNAWTYVNDKKYFITVTDLKITESSVSDIYVVQIEYEYSLGDTF